MDAAAISYIETCLKYRALRLRKKWSVLASREQPILNSLIRDDSLTEQVDLISDPSHPFDKDVVNKPLIEQAMSNLTRKRKVYYPKAFST